MHTTATRNESAPAATTGAPSPKNKLQNQYSTNLELALKLAGLNWFVFPCHPGPDPKKIKKPLTKNGKDNATTVQVQIMDWWKRWPNALIGIYCEKSGIFAVDLDCKNGLDGLADWENLVIHKGNSTPVICGPVQVTLSGGRHLIFEYPEGKKIPNNAGKLAPGIDLRSNGYICTGQPGYTWCEGHGPETPLMAAPAWLLNVIEDMQTPKAGPTKPTPRGLAIHQPPDKVSWAAVLLERLAQYRCDNYQEWVNVGMALSELGESGFPLWANWSQRSSKFEPGACERKWKTFTPGHGITLGSLHHWAEEDNPTRKAPSVQFLEPPEDPPWPEEFQEELPPPDDQDTEDTLPIEAFTPALPKNAILTESLLTEAANVGPWLSEYVSFGVKAAPMAPVIFHEVLGLALLSTAIARRVYLRMGSRNIYPNIYAFIVANSTLYTKSTAFETATQTLNKAGLSHFILPETITPQSLISEMTNRTPDTFTTWEKEDQDSWRDERKFSAQRAWWMDESAGFLDMFEQKTMADLLNLVLKFFDCPEKLAASQTIGRGRQTLRQVYLSICGPTTPAAMRTHLTNTSNWGNGLFARFIFVTPDTEPVIHFFPPELEIPSSIFTPLNTLAVNRLPMPQEINGHYAMDSFKAELGSGVLELWKKYHEAMLTLVKDQKIPEKLSSNYGRFHIMAIKIAMQLASIDWAIYKSKDIPIIITPGHWARAQILTEKFRASLHRLLEDTTRQSRDDDTEAKIIMLLRANSKGMAGREIAQKLHKVGNDRIELDKILSLLVKDGVLKMDKRKGKAGPSTDIYLCLQKTRNT